MAGRMDYRNFHDVFGTEGRLPYDQYINRDIESKRKSLGGVLFVDRVFTALGVSKGMSGINRSRRRLLCFLS